MTPELIEAIGRYIVMPAITVLLLWIVLRS